MVEGGGGPSFPVLFFDGEKEMNIGDVKINPSLEYKPFQLMLSQKIGISPNQISIYLVDRRKSPFPEDRRRIPITGKVNFASICRQEECCFLVVLKRSRKSRNRKERLISAVEFADFLPENVFSPTAMRTVPENLILLRRNQKPTPFYDRLTQSELEDLDGRLQNLRAHMAMVKGTVNSPETNLAADPFPTIDEIYGVNSTWSTMMTNSGGQKAFCEECWKAKENGVTTAFHHCVNDAVITRFTTRLGPINRPNKSLF